MTEKSVLTENILSMVDEIFKEMSAGIQEDLEVNLEIKGGKEETLTDVKKTISDNLKRLEKLLEKRLGGVVIWSDGNKRIGVPELTQELIRCLIENNVIEKYDSYMDIPTLAIRDLENTILALL